MSFTEEHGHIDAQHQGQKQQQPQWSKNRTPRFNPPSNPVAALVWRWMMWWYVALPFSMMEPWEILLVLCMIGVMAAFIIYSVFKYLPQHAYIIFRRAKFYLYGEW